VADSVTTLAEILNDSGYETGAVIAGYTLAHAWGLSQGFQLYDDNLIGKAGPWRGTKRADQVTKAAMAWLGDHSGGPFFLWVHYFDPHHPYAPPERFGLESGDNTAADTMAVERAKYNAEVRFADEQIGRLIAMMDSLGLTANTMLVFCADHGEGLGDHNYMRHGALLYEEQVSIPMMMVLDGVLPGGEVCDILVESTDLVPSVLNAIGVQYTGRKVDGRNLLKAIKGEERRTHAEFARGHRRSYLSSGFAEGVDGTQIPIPGRLFFVRSGSNKLIWTDNSVELYDLHADPSEATNVAELKPDVVEELSKYLQDWISSPWVDEVTDSKEIDEATKAKLRSLGYLD
jgi:arylsulfatase A-like enzyme